MTKDSFRSKNIVILCDGTWKSKDSIYVTNIVKLSKILESSNKQKIYYDKGVGTGGLINKFTGGVFGKGINQNILDAYNFLIDNYNYGDKIFLFGFSRGAYTVRSLAGLIYNSGILKEKNQNKIDEAFNLYRSEIKPTDSKSKIFRLTYSQNAEVEFLGCFDTVGALGIPSNIFNLYNNYKYSFHDTKLSPIIKNAFHLVAVDEKRSIFEPCLMNIKNKKKTNVVQTYFSGVHSDIGGGYKESDLSDITLSAILNLSKKFGLKLKKNIKLNPKPDGVIHNSLDFISNIFFTKWRFVDKNNIHDSVIERINKVEEYEPKNITF